MGWCGAGHSLRETRDGANLFCRANTDSKLLPVLSFGASEKFTNTSEASHHLPQAHRPPRSAQETLQLRLASMAYRQKSLPKCVDHTSQKPLPTFEYWPPKRLRVRPASWQQASSWQFVGWIEQGPKETGWSTWLSPSQSSFKISHLGNEFNTCVELTQNIAPPYTRKTDSCPASSQGKQNTKRFQQYLFPRMFSTDPMNVTCSCN